MVKENAASGSRDGNTKEPGRVGPESGAARPGSVVIMPTIIKDRREIEMMRRAGKLGCEILHKMREAAGLLQNVLGAAEVKGQPRITKHISAAINQINTALSVH